MRECVTKGGETNSSSAVSVGLKGGEEQFPELRHTTEGTGSFQPSPNPASLPSECQPTPILWLLSQAIKMRIRNKNSTAYQKETGLCRSEWANRHLCWTPSSCQCQFRSVSRILPFHSLFWLGETLWFLPFIFPGSQNHFHSFNLNVHTDPPFFPSQSVTHWVLAKSQPGEENVGRGCSWPCELSPDTYFNVPCVLTSWTPEIISYLFLYFYTTAYSIYLLRTRDNSDLSWDTLSK